MDSDTTLHFPDHYALPVTPALAESDLVAPSRVFGAAERAVLHDPSIGLPRDPEADRGPALDRPHRSEAEVMATLALRNIFPDFARHKAVVAQRIVMARRTHPSVSQRRAAS
ncbi:hypothetical protein KDA23_03440 [Candidatus Saccharibacteria bacterium]|nr:hypothetical protein [Candidatus Saccharibacteria bacterium]